MQIAARRLLLAIAIVLAGCASSGGRSATARQARSDLITRDEIGAGAYHNAYDLIQALRPRWLAVHGPDSILGTSTEVQVRLDDYNLGGVQTLRSIPLTGISTIQFVDGVTAAGRWGQGYADGAIVITTLSRSR